MRAQIYRIIAGGRTGRIPAMIRGFLAVRAGGRFSGRLGQLTAGRFWAGFGAGIEFFAGDQRFGIGRGGRIAQFGHGTGAPGRLGNPDGVPVAKRPATARAVQGRIGDSVIAVDLSQRSPPFTFHIIWK
jgi:hypothetical protein